MRFAPAVLLVVSACSEPDPEPVASPEAAEQAPTPLGSAHELMMDTIARVRREVDCEESIHRYLCGTLDLPGTTKVLPDEPVRLPGVSVGIRSSRTLERGARLTGAASFLTMTADSAEIRRAPPKNSAQRSDFAALVGRLGAYLRGEADDVAVPLGSAYVISQDFVVPKAVTVDEHGVGWMGEYPTRLYRVTGRPGQVDLLVGIQDVGAGGFLHLFPDQGALVLPDLVEAGVLDAEGNPIRPTAGLGDPEAAPGDDPSQSDDAPAASE